MEFLRNYENAVKSNFQSKMLLRGIGKMALMDNSVSSCASDLQKVHNKESDRTTLMADTNTAHFYLASAECLWG